MATLIHPQHYGPGMIRTPGSPIVQVVHPHPLGSPTFPPQVLTYPPVTYASPQPNVVMLPFNQAVDPFAVCQQKGHAPVTNYGAIGILCAIFCFPIGILCCLFDQRSTCTRCGTVLATGCD